MGTRLSWDGSSVQFLFVGSLEFTDYIPRQRNIIGEFEVGSLEPTDYIPRQRNPGRFVPWIVSGPGRERNP